MIFLDTNVISKTFRKHSDDNVMAWLAMHDESLAIPTITIAEIAFGIAKIRPDEHCAPLQDRLDAWRGRFAERIFPFTKRAALDYGELLDEAFRAGIGLSAPDAMIAAVARVNRGELATRDRRDFSALKVLNRGLTIPRLQAALALCSFSPAGGEKVEVRGDGRRSGNMNPHPGPLPVSGEGDNRPAGRSIRLISRNLEAPGSVAGGAFTLDLINRWQ